MHEPTIWERLAEPFDPDTVQWRVGATNKRRRQQETGDKNALPTRGEVVAYIDARDVMDRLDAVCGENGWQSHHYHLGPNRVACEIKVYDPATETWIAKTDGAGETDIEGDKGAFSGALKRAAVSFGIARYLYALPQVWVNLENGRDIPKAEHDQLRVHLAKVSTEKEWGGRAEKHLFNVLKNTLQSYCINREMVKAWGEENKGNLAQLPVRLRDELRAEVRRIMDGFEAKDAA